MLYAIDSRPVAGEACPRLGLRMEPAKLLDSLAVEQVESTSFIVLTYEGNDPVEQSCAHRVHSQGVGTSRG
jgi:hypothetical protein